MYVEKWFPVLCFDLHLDNGCAPDVLRVSDVDLLPGFDLSELARINPSTVVLDPRCVLVSVVLLCCNF